MVADRIIDNYLKEVSGNLPLKTRRAAVSDLREKIYEMLNTYCEGGRPGMRDAKAVLKAIGSPESVANQYRAEAAKTRKKTRRKTLKTLRRVQEMLFAAAILMMMSGLFAVVLGGTGNIKIFLLGALTAVALMVIKIFAPIGAGDAADTFAGEEIFAE